MSYLFGPGDFIRHKYGTDFPGFLAVWNRQNRRTRYFPAGEFVALADYVATIAATEDLYVALGLQAEGLEPHKRGGADSVIAIPGFFADIDFAEAKTSTKNYPRDEAEALEILGKFPFAPTALVRTGNGLHAHWDLVELYRCGSDEARARAKRVSTNFQRYLADHFRMYGREIDSVGDLARNCRLPGTLNHKTQPAKPVELLEPYPGPRHLLAEIAAAVEPKAPASAAHHRRSLSDSTTLADHSAIMQGCRWYREVVVDGADRCDEPNWYAGASITACCRDGERHFHEYSQQHLHYNEAEATRKFERARTEAGPRTCQSITRDLGHAACEECPYWGKITSPVQIGTRHRV